MDVNGILEYINEHVLECAICTNTFKRPKALPCLHVFCLDCIERYIEFNLTQNFFSCPTCREKHELPQDGVDALRDAFLQKSLLELSAIVQKETISCSSCKSGFDSISACSTCGDFLCMTCDKNHKEMRLTRNHDLIPIRALLDPNQLVHFQRMRYTDCKQHKNEFCKLYCKDDHTQICHMCTFDPNHKGHDVITMEARLQELKSAIHKIKPILHHNIENLRQNVNKTLCEVKDLEEEVTKEVKHIKERINLVAQLLNAYETDLIKEIQAISGERKQFLETKAQQVEEQIKQYESILHKSVLVDSLPIYNSIEIAETIAVTDFACFPAIQTHEERKRPYEHCVISSLEKGVITAVFKSLVGHLTETWNEDLFRVIFCDMPQHMMEDTILVLQYISKEFHHLERNAVGCFNEIAATCCEAMQERHGGLWNATVAVSGFGGAYVHQVPGFSIAVAIDGMDIYLYRGQDEN